MSKALRLFLSLMLVASIGTFTSPARALVGTVGGGLTVVGAVTGGPAAWKFGVAALLGLGLNFGGEALRDNIIRGRSFFGRTTLSLVTALVWTTGIILLDEQTGALQVSELPSSVESQTGMTPDERDAFNTEREQFNALLNQVVQEGAAQGLSETATHQRFVELATSELSSDAMAAYNKIKAAAIADVH